MNTKENRVIIIYTPNKLGGVRVFCQTLSAAFKIMFGEDQVLVVAGGWTAIVTALKNWNKETLYIASLGGGIFCPLFSKSIYVLHGFPNRMHYKYIRYFLIKIGTQLSVLLANKIVSVSHWTKIGNAAFLGISTDGVIYNPLRQEFFVTSQKTKKKNILYVGSLIASKRIIEIAQAFISLCDKNKEIYENYTLQIVGDGPLEEYLKSLPQNKNIQILNSITDVVVLRTIYQEAEIFISLNEIEPFGIVFTEAISSGCAVIAPINGGQTEFLIGYNKAIFVNNTEDVSEIERALTHAISNVSGAPTGVDLNVFLPKTVANAYLSLFDEIK